MLSLPPEQEFDRVAAGLAGGGACALVLIEAEPLGRIERRYGSEAYLRDEGLRKMLEVVNLQPSGLVLEISESESIDNSGVFREVARSCRELGIRIAIDDGGTGYARLEAIMEIAPDFIKTDMTLVRGIDADPPRREVVRAINALALGIGAQVIAEGIETNRELRVLRDLGVRYAQGYYSGAALRAE